MNILRWSQNSNERKHSVRNRIVFATIQTVKEEHINIYLQKMVVIEPDLDCDILVRLGDVGVLHAGEGVVGVVLVVEDVGVDKDGLVRLVGVEP